ncbi:hypothetical protein FRC12_000716, partial [Ceratobasidium sp. 428]
VKRHRESPRHLEKLKEYNARPPAPRSATASAKGRAPPESTPSVLSFSSYNFGQFESSDWSPGNLNSNNIRDATQGENDDEPDSGADSDSDSDSSGTEDLFVCSQGPIRARDTRKQHIVDSDDEWTTDESDDDQSTDQRTTLLFGGPGKASDPPKPLLWGPYPSKAMSLADALSSSRRVRFSRQHMEALLEYARETRGEEIPTYTALRSFQKKLKTQMGDPSQRCVSSTGTVYYLNAISRGLQDVIEFSTLFKFDHILLIDQKSIQDMSNPFVRPRMTFYPHSDGDRMSQAWHGRKMIHDMPDYLLTPCARINGQIFYVNELVRRKDDWFIPLRWITVGATQELCAIGHIAKDTVNGIQVNYATRKTVKASTFVESFQDLQKRKSIPQFDDDSQRFRQLMPHPLRAKAGNRMVYSVPLIVFMDDASGNVSKQWNKHWSSYLSNASVPREDLQSEYHVCFVTTSTHAAPAELSQGIRSSIEEAFDNPVVAFDCVTKEEVLVRPFALFWAGDNPMQAEHCSSSGLNSSHFCRTCDVGGSDEHKQSLAGYKSLFCSGNIRVASETRRLIEERLEMALKPKMIQKIKEKARDTGIKDSTAQSVIERILDLGKRLRNPKKGLPRRSPQEVHTILQSTLDQERKLNCINPLLDMTGVDIHCDTPTELLHTVLLGIVKYYWAQSVFIIDKAKKLSVLESRLASVNLGGLNLPKMSARYVCQYRGSLIGKHFKTLVQVMSFVTHDLLPAPVLTAWLLMGRLSALLWYTAIDNIKAYLDELQSVINDFLLKTAECSPSIMILKPKFHFLVHLPMYIKRFGPALLFSTERFESFNGVFRAASTFSNRQAPSRDIAQRFGDLDRVKHIASGGYWHNGKTWVCASNTLLEFTSSNKVFNKLLGLPARKSPTPGSIVLLPKALARGLLTQDKPKPWSLFTKAMQLGTCAPPGCADATYFAIKSTVSQSGDTIGVGCDIVFCQRLFAHVRAIFGFLAPDGKKVYFVAAAPYELGPTKHNVFDMPMATRSATITCIPVKDIVCLVNMQHDCTNACTNTRAVREVQEREQTNKTRYSIQHSDNTRFVINLHAFHNAELIRRALPADLYHRRDERINVDDVYHAAVQKLSASKLQKDRLAAARKQAKGIVTEAIEAVTEDADGAEPPDDDADDDIPGVQAPKRGVKRKKRTPTTSSTKRRKRTKS